MEMDKEAEIDNEEEDGDAKNFLLYQEAGQQGSKI